MNLEQRLDLIPEAVKPVLIDALVSPKVRPRDSQEVEERRLKYNLTDSIQDFLNRAGTPVDPNFGNTLYSTLTKEPIKRIHYGLINAEQIPFEVFQQLLQWEASYFLAGLWNKKSTPIASKQYRRDQLVTHPLPLIITDTIEVGVHSIRKVHRDMGKQGKYTTDPVTPFDEEILKACYATRSAYWRKKRENAARESATNEPDIKGTKGIQFEQLGFLPQPTQYELEQSQARKPRRRR